MDGREEGFDGAVSSRLLVSQTATPVAILYKDKRGEVEVWREKSAEEEGYRSHGAAVSRCAIPQLGHDCSHGAAVMPKLPAASGPLAPTSFHSTRSTSLRSALENRVAGRGKD